MCLISGAYCMWLILLPPCWLYVYSIITCMLKFAICLSTCTLQMDPFPSQSCQTSSYKNHFLSILLLDVTKFIPLVIVLEVCKCAPCDWVVFVHPSVGYLQQLGGVPIWNSQFLSLLMYLLIVLIVDGCFSSHTRIPHEHSLLEHS